MNTPLKIRFERRGGFTGIPLRIHLEEKDLPIEAQMRLRELLQAHALERHSRPSTVGADRFTYHLTVINEDQEHTFEFSESEMSEEVRSLVEYLSQAARRARRLS
ncbi:MAG: hypothetical protein J7555_00210 [Chloroflexi bacterium]|jgi:hypothetical protein|nr:hypothetical protein [Chloroflexota bacterium]